MAVKVERWQASDNSLWMTEAQADKQNLYLEVKDSLDEFVTESGYFDFDDFVDTIRNRPEQLDKLIRYLVSIQSSPQLDKLIQFLMGVQNESR